MTSMIDRRTNPSPVEHNSVNSGRQRFRRAWFEAFSRFLGPYTLHVGAEREWTVTSPADPECMWLHPAQHAVVAALRLALQSFQGCDGASVPCTVVVPYMPKASWWKITRFFRVAG